MANQEIISIILIGIGFALLAGVAVSTSLPGDNTADPSKAKYDLKASVGMEVNSINGNPIINEDSFTSCITKSSVFNFNMARGGGLLSLTEVGGNKMKWTLNGPIKTSVTDTDDLGSIDRVAQSKTASFEATNLPPGTYVLHMNAVNNDGSDYYKQEIVLGPDNAVSSCGGVLG